MILKTTVAGSSQFASFALLGIKWVFFTKTASFQRTA